jgi:hypothetical protein
VGNVDADFVETAYVAKFDPSSLYSWLADSGTISRICNNCAAFVELCSADVSVEGVGEHRLRALGRGVVLLDCNVDGMSITHRLLDVLYAPTCTHNLVSVSRLDDAGMKAEFSNGNVAFVGRSDGKVMAMGQQDWTSVPIGSTLSESRAHMPLQKRGTGRGMPGTAEWTFGKEQDGAPHERGTCRWPRR